MNKPVNYRVFDSWDSGGIGKMLDPVLFYLDADNDVWAMDSVGGVLEPLNSDRHIVMQSFGYEDVDGRTIFENDLVKFKTVGQTEGPEYVGVVRFDRPMAKFVIIVNETLSISFTNLATLGDGSYRLKDLRVIGVCHDDI